MAHYLIVGSGRTARHFSHYFQLLGLPFDQWNRKEPSDLLEECLENATHVLLLISDSALNDFYLQTLKPTGKIQNRVLIHFSGALEIEGVESVHPLMSFSQDLYDLETYRNIPFVTTSAKSFQELLPGLSNPFSRIRPEQKPLYHALCVLSGNFTTLLWQKMNSEFKSLGLPEGISIPYMTQVFKNLTSDASKALTGPLARKDYQTLQANDRALQNDPYQKVFRSFVEAYDPEAFKTLEGGV